MRCLEQNEGNVVFCTSDKFKNIKIGDTTVSADKQTSFSITQDGDLNIDNGTLVSVNEKGKVAILEQGNTYKVAVAVNPKDTFIITDISKYESDSNNEQILKDYVLSPSAPRN